MENADDRAVSQMLDLVDAADDLMSNRFVLGDHHFTLAVYSDSLKSLRDNMSIARAALADPKDLRRVSEIGYAHGFQSEAQFSRAIKAAFGATPSELRHQRYDFRSGYTPELWAQRGWIDEAASGGVRRLAEVAPAWRPGAAAAAARILHEERRGAA